MPFAFKTFIRKFRCLKPLKPNDDGAVPLKFIPYDLLISILEKMTYKDFIQLSLCSRISLELCANLPKNVRIKEHVKRICLGRGVSVYDHSGTLYGNKYQEERPRVRISTDELIVEAIFLNQKNLDFIRRNQLVTRSLQISGTFVKDVGLIKELMMLSRPLHLTFEMPAVASALYLEELQKISSLQMPIHNVTNEILLSFKASKIVLRTGGDVYLTNAGIVELIMQWILGKRKIEHFEVPIGAVAVEGIFYDLRDYVSYFSPRKGIASICLFKECLQLSWSNTLFVMSSTQSCSRHKK